MDPVPNAMLIGSIKEEQMRASELLRNRGQGHWITGTFHNTTTTTHDKKRTLKRKETGGDPSSIEQSSFIPFGRNFRVPGAKCLFWIFKVRFAPKSRAHVAEVKALDAAALLF